MKRHKTQYNKEFVVNNHTVNIELFSQCVTSNPQERSYRKKLCKVTFLGAVINNKRKSVDINFSSMRAATVFIANKVDTHTMTIDVFGEQYCARTVVLLCNYKLYTIYSINNKDVWMQSLEYNNII